MSARRISPKKLLNSKWTAREPHDKEKHFIVVAVATDPTDLQCVVSVTLEAVLTRRHWTTAWRDLNDEAKWGRGWSG